MNKEREYREEAGEGTWDVKDEDESAKPGPGPPHMRRSISAAFSSLWSSCDLDFGLHPDKMELKRKYVIVVV